MNDFSRSALFFLHAFFVLNWFDLLWLRPRESDPCLPPNQFLVLALDGGVFVVGALPLLHHRFVFALLGRRNLDHGAGFTKRDASNGPEEGLHDFGHDLEGVSRVLNEESEAV